MNLRILQYVYFGLWGNDTSADVVTKVLQMAPDASWVRGSRIADPTRPASHKWAIECRGRDFDTGEQTRNVLARVRPIAPLIRQLTADRDVVARLTVKRYFDDEDGQLLGWSLDQTDLELLISPNADLDVDEDN